MLSFKLAYFTRWHGQTVIQKNKKRSERKWTILDWWLSIKITCQLEKINFVFLSLFLSFKLFLDSSSQNRSGELLSLILLCLLGQFSPFDYWVCEGKKKDKREMLDHYKTYLDLLYSNSMWRQSSIPTSILMEELSSG